MNEINWEEVSCKIIVLSNSAIIKAQESVGYIKSGQLRRSLELLNQADVDLMKAEKEHLNIIAIESEGTNFEYKIIYMHAENQMSNARVIINYSRELVDVWKKIKKIK